MASSRNAILLAALGHYRSQQISQAEALLEQLIEQDANDADALFLLGSLRMETDIDAAEALLSRCAALAPQHLFVRHYLGKLHHLRGDDDAAVVLLRQAIELNPNFAPTFNDLGTSLHETGEREQAIEAFDRAIAIDPDYTTAHINRGILLAEMRRPMDADAAFRRVIASSPRTAEAWHNCGVAHYHLGEFEQAIDACRQALALHPAHRGASGTLLQALGRVGREDEARQAGIDWAHRQGIVTTRCTGERAEARILLVRAAEFCNVPTDFLFDRKRFDTVTMYLPPSTDRADGSLLRLDGLPEVDVVFNAIGDPDRGEAFFPVAVDLCRKLDRPILNPPERVRRTQRDRLPSLLADIPGLVVPETRRMTREDLVAFAATYDGAEGPLLLRPIGAHGGDDLVRIDDRTEFAPYLAVIPAKEHYVSTFWDYRSADGYFRKYRLIFVDREVYPYHLAISKHWLVHYWRAEMSDWMMREEQMFLSDLRTAFRGVAEDAINEVARRLDLDYGGMDCTILPDGRVLVFEANSTMLVHLRESRRDCAYKHEHVPRIIDAMSEFVLRRRGQQAASTSPTADPQHLPTTDCTPEVAVAS